MPTQSPRAARISSCRAPLIFPLRSCFRCPATHVARPRSPGSSDKMRGIRPCWWRNSLARINQQSQEGRGGFRHRSAAVGGAGRLWSMSRLQARSGWVRSKCRMTWRTRSFGTRQCRDIWLIVSPRRYMSLHSAVEMHGPQSSGSSSTVLAGRATTTEYCYPLLMARDEEFLQALDTAGS